MFLWEEAYDTIIYLQNMGPQKVLGRMNLEETFTGNKPKLGHLCIFGCLVYCQVPSEKRMKLETTVEKVNSVGYNKTSKIYRVYILALQRMVQRYVKFEDRYFRKSCDSNLVVAQVQEQEAPKEEGIQPLQIARPQTVEMCNQVQY